MAIKNEILPWALGSDPNVLTPDELADLPARIAGWSAGTAKSKEVNAVVRQAMFGVHMMARFVAERSRHAVLDDGDVDSFLTNFLRALASYSGAINTPLRPYDMAVISATVASPPSVRKQGDAYVIPVGATGVWTGRDNLVTQWTDSDGWVYADFQKMAKVGVADTGDIIKRTDTGWRSLYATDAEAVAGTAVDVVINPARLLKAIQTLGPQFTASSLPPSAPRLNDQWFDTEYMLLFSRISDGVTELWLQNTL